jgi:hypothetical protein
VGEPASYTIKPISGAGTFLTMIPVLLFCTVGFAVGGSERGIVYGAFGFLIFRLLIVRRVVLRDHASGVRLTRAGRFDDALAAFQRSEEVWRKRAFFDRHRALLLGSSVRYTFHFLSLYNQAYCLARLSRGDEARIKLDELDSISPDSALAQTLRDLMNA